MVNASMRLQMLLICTALMQTMSFARWGTFMSAHRNYHTERFQQSSMHADQSAAVDINLNECVKTIDVLSLESIRNSLIRQEETIIFALIERAQFRRNEIVYKPDGFGAKLGIPAGSRDPSDSKSELSFFEYMLVGTEALHCMARRYLSPEEHAFFPERLPEGGPLHQLPSLTYSQELLSTVGGANKLNFNKRLLKNYINCIVPAVCKSGDDEQHGSTALCDIAALQALSRRVHYGKFVAESKYRSDPTEYQRLVDADDDEGVMVLLTNSEVEAKVLRRSRLKAATYGKEPVLSEHSFTNDDDAAYSNVNLNLHSSVEGKVDPSVIEEVYRDIIIPMTKEIEIAYLFLRCGKESPPKYREY